MALGCVLLAGFLVAIVVTLSHESEEIMLEREPSFAKVAAGPNPSGNAVAAFSTTLGRTLQTQFLGTRDIQCPEWVTEYLFGGMQYQLEHHLFPTMPRYKYRYVTRWAGLNGKTGAATF